MKTSVFRAALVGFALVLMQPTISSASIIVGDIVAPQSDNQGTVIVIHPSTGNRELVSLFGSMGSGPKMSRPSSILILPDENFLVADTLSHPAITRIAPISGNRTDVSSPSIGTGPWAEVNTLLRTGGGDTIIVAENFVAKVDLNTGNRTVISGLGVGSGPSFAFNGAGGAVLSATGHLLIGVYDQPAIYDVDLATGARTVLSGLGQGAGPDLPHVMDLVTLPSGQIIVSARSFDSGPFIGNLLRVDPLTGNRTLISSGPYIDFEYERLALGFNGQLLGAVPGQNAIYSVNPTNGSRTLISGNGLGTGPSLFWGDVVVVPEPSTLALITIGSVGLLLAARQRPRSERT
jgi:hypothetical protein